ncbi:MLP-like protein 31 [Linum grandiflorum]
MSCCSLLHGKLEAYFGVRVAAEVFHDIFSCRPHHVSNMSPSKVKSCDVHEGEFGKPGSLVAWNYIHDGGSKVAKSAMEDIDDVNLSTTYKVIEGDLMKEYKNIKVVVKATPQKKTEGDRDWCLVHWVFGL